MALRFTYLYLLSAALLLSCKKNEQNPTPGLRQRLFTNGTEIKDESVKKRFIQKSQTSFTVPTAANPDYLDYAIRFVTPDTAIFGTRTARFSVIKNGTQYLFYSPLSVLIRADSDSRVRALLKYTSPLLLTQGTSGSTHITKEVRVGYRDESNMRIALLHYRLKRTLPNIGSREESGSLFNEFNEAAIATISSNDTFAVQESSFIVPVQ